MIYSRRLEDLTAASQDVCPGLPIAALRHGRRRRAGMRSRFEYQKLPQNVEFGTTLTTIAQLTISMKLKNTGRALRGLQSSARTPRSEPPGSKPRLLRFFQSRSLKSTPERGQGLFTVSS